MKVDSRAPAQAAAATETAAAAATTETEAAATTTETEAAAHHSVACDKWLIASTSACNAVHCSSSSAVPLNKILGYFDVVPSHNISQQTAQHDADMAYISL
jgi:hypothetical protein